MFYRCEVFFQSSNWSMFFGWCINLSNKSQVPWRPSWTIDFFFLFGFWALQQRNPRPFILGLCYLRNDLKPSHFVLIHSVHCNSCARALMSYHPLDKTKLSLWVSVYCISLVKPKSKLLKDSKISIDKAF